MFSFLRGRSQKWRLYHHTILGGRRRSVILGTQILCISIPKCIARPLDHIIFGEKKKKILRQSNTQNTWVQRIHRGRRQHWVWGVVVNCIQRCIYCVSMCAKRTIATRVCVVVIAYVYSMHILLQDYTSIGVERAWRPLVLKKKSTASLFPTPLFPVACWAPPTACCPPLTSEQHPPISLSLSKCFSLCNLLIFLCPISKNKRIISLSFSLQSGSFLTPHRLKPARILKFLINISPVKPGNDDGLCLTLFWRTILESTSNVVSNFDLCPVYFNFTPSLGEN